MVSSRKDSQIAIPNAYFETPSNSRVLLTS